MEKVAGYIALAFAAVSFAFSLVVQTETGSKTSCQYSINKEFLTTLQQPAKIGNENTDNINRLIKGVFSTRDQKTALKEYQDYLTELDKINGELSKATYPSFQSC